MNKHTIDEKILGIYIQIKCTWKKVYDNNGIEESAVSYQFTSKMCMKGNLLSLRLQRKNNKETYMFPNINYMKRWLLIASSCIIPTLNKDISFKSSNNTKMKDVILSVKFPLSDILEKMFGLRYQITCKSTGYSLNIWL